MDLASEESDNAILMVETTSEGERLRRLLDAHRYEQKDLAAKVGLTRAAIGIWCRTSRFSDFVWPKVKAGLAALQLDPAAVRPEEGTAPRSEDLTPLLHHWSRDQLTTLRRILESSETSRAIVLAYLQGALRQHP